MAGIDTNVIIENLTQLLQNSVNMTSVFYDIFLNPEPMDVELQQYNAEGELITISIPNRAKDRKIALTGEGSPEGVVEANVGTCYVDEANQAVYFKVTGTGNTGWVIIPTQSSINEYVRSYLENNDFVTEGDMERYLDTNNYVTSSNVSTMLSEYKPTMPMQVVASVSGTVSLSDNSGYAITLTGNTTFSLPTVTDRTRLHKIFIQLKMPSPAVTVNLGTTNYFNKTTPSLTSAGMYDINYELDFNNNVWVVGVTPKGTAS